MKTFRGHIEYPIYDYFNSSRGVRNLDPLSMLSANILVILIATLYQNQIWSSNRIVILKIVLDKAKSPWIEPAKRVFF